MFRMSVGRSTLYEHKVELTLNIIKNPKEIVVDAHVAWQLSVLFISIVTIVVVSTSLCVLTLSLLHRDRCWQWLRWFLE